MLDPEFHEALELNFFHRGVNIPDSQPGRISTNRKYLLINQQIMHSRSFLHSCSSSYLKDDDSSHILSFPL